MVLTNSQICPVKWCLYMIEKIPAKPHHNLFSFEHENQMVPLTYRDLTEQMREWLRLAGIKKPTGFLESQPAQRWRLRSI